MDDLAIPPVLTTPVKVNIAAMRQMFRPCDPDFILEVCHAKCCRSTTDPTGIAVVVAPVEAVRLRRRGATVDDATGRVQPVNKRCPFEDPTSHLCTVHVDGEEPLGCVISPFTVNATGTLIVRNRYRLLPCFKAEGAMPVAIAHQRSLRVLFGVDIARHIAALAAREDMAEVSITLPAPTHLVDMLRHKNAASKAIPT